MAGDWIKMRMDLHTDPKVVRITCAVCAHGVRSESPRSAQRCAVVGALHLVWSLFDTHSIDGELAGYSPDVIDDLVGMPGFAAAMESVEWLERTPKGLAMHNFAKHNGQGAKRRAMHAERVRENRRPESRAHPVRIDGAQDAHQRREEERREEEPAPETASPKIAPNCPSAEERNQIRQGLIRIGIESGAAQQVSLHPLLTVAMVTSNMASVKKSPGVKSHAAVLLTRLRRELEIAE